MGRIDDENMHSNLPYEDDAIVEADAAASGSSLSARKHKTTASSPAAATALVSRPPRLLRPDEAARALAVATANVNENVASSANLDSNLAIVQQQQRHVPKRTSTRRRSKNAVLDAGLGLAIEICESPTTPRVSKRAPSRAGAGRPHKRKAAAADDVVAGSSSKKDGRGAETEALVVTRVSSSKRKSRKATEATETSQAMDWRQYTTDLVMWRDTSKSAFLFGSGMFCVLSSCFTQDIPFSFVTIASYISLVYLATVFLYKSFLYRGIMEVEPSPANFEITEDDVLKVARIILPFVNAFLAKAKEMFSGEPSTTLKLAAVLWILIQCGHRMTVWTLIRIAFFLAFTIPKFYCCYSNQLHVYGEHVIERGMELWNACSHKKIMVVVAAALAWKMSSISSRLVGVFILIITFRLYQHALTFETFNQTEHTMEEENNAHNKQGS